MTDDREYSFRSAIVDSDATDMGLPSYIERTRTLPRIEWWTTPQFIRLYGTDVAAKESAIEPGVWGIVRTTGLIKASTLALCWGMDRFEVEAVRVLLLNGHPIEYPQWRYMLDAETFRRVL